MNIVAITYGDNQYKRAKKLNLKMAKRHGANKVIGYGPNDIPQDFKNKNSEIWNQKRGGGYWLWKSWIVLQTLELMKDGDYLFYSDAGSFLVQPIQYFIDNMIQNDCNIMTFCLTHFEKKFTKRDAFIIMDCDSEKFTDSVQICATYFIVKKNNETIELFKKYLFYSQDERIITDKDNVMGFDNYDIFVEHRHDQSIFSLLCKKNSINPYRDPSQYGTNQTDFSEDVLQRSKYPQMIVSHRNGKLGSLFQYHYENRKWYPYITKDYYLNKASKIKRYLLNRIIKNEDKNQ